MIDGLLLYLFILIIPEFNNFSHESKGPIMFLKQLSLTMLSSVAHNEGVWGGVAPNIFTLAQNGDEWLASHLDHFICSERTLGTYWAGD